MPALERANTKLSCGAPKARANDEGYPINNEQDRCCKFNHLHPVHGRVGLLLRGGLAADHLVLAHSNHLPSPGMRDVKHKAIREKSCGGRGREGVRRCTRTHACEMRSASRYLTSGVCGQRLNLRRKGGHFVRLNGPVCERGSNEEKLNKPRQWEREKY